MRTIILPIFVFSLFSTLLNASCEYEAKAVSVAWEAYKTPAKAGVKGAFDKVKMDEVEAKTVASLLKELKAKIDSASVNTGNKGRDKTLGENFFKLFVSGAIVAEVVDVKGDDQKGSMITKITMNGVSKEIPLRYIVEGDELKADGFIDLFDFALNDALASINKACYDLHGGKTWNDVAISMTMKVKKECK